MRARFTRNQIRDQIDADANGLTLAFGVLLLIFFLLTIL